MLSTWVTPEYADRYLFFVRFFFSCIFVSFFFFFFFCFVLCRTVLAVPPLCRLSSACCRFIVPVEPPDTAARRVVVPVAAI